MKKIALLFVLVTTGFIISCDKNPTTTEYIPPDSSFGLIYTKVLKPSCALSGCHDGEQGFSHPKLTGLNTYNEMVQDHVHNSKAKDSELWLVKPFDADSSFFYQKLIFDETEFNFGAEMPAGGLSLTEGQIEFIRQWISEGAPLDGHVADRTLIE